MHIAERVNRFSPNIGTFSGDLCGPHADPRGG
jgi:hypothetical protein